MIFLYYSTNDYVLLKSFIANFKKSNKKSILIIPDQYSFYAEGEIYKKLNVKDLKILTFNKLCFEIFKKHGYVAGNFASKMKKILTLNHIIFNLQPKLKIKKNLTYSETFAQIILKDIENLKKNNITPKIFKEKYKKIKDENLKSKAKMLQTIFNMYEEKLKKSFKDPTENIKKACEISYKTNFFSSFNISFLFFIDFNQSQIKLIEMMAKQTTIKFFINFEKNQPLFQISKNLIKIIKKIATQNNIKIKKEIFIKNNLKKSKELQTIENNIFRTKKKNKIKKIKSNNFKIIVNQNRETEVENALFEILKLKNIGFEWNEIAILCDNLNDYVAKLKINLKNFNIPYFVEEKKTASDFKIIKTVKNILNLVENHNIKSYLNALKFGITKFKLEEIAIFENQIKKYNINIKLINSPIEKVAAKYLKLGLIIPVEQEIIVAEKVKNPVCRIIKIFNKKSYSTDEISMKIIKILEILGVRKKIENYVENLDLKYILKNEWNTLIEMMEGIYEITKKNKISINKFKFLFSNAAKMIKTKSVVPFSNSIYVGDFAKTIPTNPKATIIIGIQPECFPILNSSSYSLFTQNEILKLKKYNLNFIKNVKYENSNSIFQTFRAITSSTKKLYIFLSNNQTKNLEQNNATINELKNLFLDDVVKKISEQECFFNKITKKMAFKKLMLDYHKKNQEISFLKKYFKMYNNKKTQNIKYNFYEFNNFEISPSQIEDFFLCPFSYFCKHILKIKKIETIELNNKTLGQIIHKTLHKIVSLKNFMKLTKFEIAKEVESFLDEFLKIKIFMQKNQNFKLIQQIESLKKNVSLVCNHIKNELNIIGFSPKYFEYYISQNSKIKPIEINYCNSHKVLIKGILDRVDIKEKNKLKYVRIIDYKYSDKTFNFSECLKGLNLQMIIYILTLNKNLKTLKNYVLSGAFYMTTVGNLRKYNSIKKNKKSNEIKNIFRNMFKFSGFLINSDENKTILDKFKTKEYEKYSILKTKNDETFFKNDAEKTLISKDELKSLNIFIKDKIKKMCQTIANMQFEKTPSISASTKEMFCSVCNFKQICNNKKIIKPSVETPLTKTEFFKFIDKKTKG